MEIEVQYTLYSKAYQLLVYTVYGNSSVLYFNFNKVARIPAKFAAGIGGGGVAREKSGREKRVRKEKFPRWWKAGEKGKDQAKLRKEALDNKNTAGTEVERYRRREVYTPLPPPTRPTKKNGQSCYISWLRLLLEGFLF